MVLFVGQRDEAGCWAFGLNPALTWSDLSLDTKLRLRDLMHEAEVRNRGAVGCCLRLACAAIVERGL